MCGALRTGPVGDLRVGVLLNELFQDHPITSVITDLFAVSAHRQQAAQSFDLFEQILKFENETFFLDRRLFPFDGIIDHTDHQFTVRLTFDKIILRAALDGLQSNGVIIQSRQDHHRDIIECLDQ